MGRGSSTRRGGGRKVRALTRKFLFLGFGREEPGMFREFCRDVPGILPGCPGLLGVFKKFLQKKFVLIFQARKKSTNPNFWVRMGYGVFHVKGVGGKKFGMSLETRKIKSFWQDIPGSCRDIPGVPEKFEKKVCVQFSPRNFSFPNGSCQKVTETEKKVAIN